MTHLFEQMYVDEIDFEGITSDKLIDMIFTEFIQRKLSEIEKILYCEDSEYSDLQSPRRIEILDDEDLWLGYTDQAISQIDQEEVWCGIVEACKILKYPEPSAEHRYYLESLYNLDWLTLRNMYLKFDRTLSLSYLMDYVTCVCKLKYTF